MGVSTSVYAGLAALCGVLSGVTVAIYQLRASRKDRTLMQRERETAQNTRAGLQQQVLVLQEKYEDAAKDRAGLIEQVAAQTRIAEEERTQMQREKEKAQSTLAGLQQQVLVLQEKYEDAAKDRDTQKRIAEEERAERIRIEIQGLRQAQETIETLKAAVKARDHEINDLFKKIEEARNDGYERGKKEVRGQYLVTVTPFLESNDKWFKKHTRSGYRFQLFVNGVPAFEPVNMTVCDWTKCDEAVKTAALDAAKTAAVEFAKALPQVLATVLPAIVG